MPYIILRLAIIFSWYIIAAYATTDMLRLCHSFPHSFIDSKSYCVHCNMPIRLRDQIPIFSYWLNHGKCHFCHAPIPLLDHRLETYLTLSFTLICIIMNFSVPSAIINFVIYEIVKILLCLHFHNTAPGFVKKFLLSLLMNIPLFALVLFFILLAKITEKI